MDKPTRDSKPSNIWTVLIVLLSVVGAYLLGDAFALGSGTWAVGMGIFVLLTVSWAVVYSYIKRKRFNRYLESLPPGQRLAAMDEYYGGAISRMTETPEYKQKEREVREKIEQRMKPILDKLGNSTEPLSFSARNQLEAELKKLQKEMVQEISPEPNSALQRTRRDNAPRR